MSGTDEDGYVFADEIRKLKESCDNDADRRTLDEVIEAMGYSFKLHTSQLTEKQTKALGRVGFTA